VEAGVAQRYRGLLLHDFFSRKTCWREDTATEPAGNGFADYSAAAAVLGNFAMTSSANSFSERLTSAILSVPKWKAIP